MITRVYALTEMERQREALERMEQVIESEVEQ